MIVAKNTLEAWISALCYVLRHGEDFVDDNNRTCREVLNLGVTIENPEADIARPIRIINGFQKWDYPDIDEIARIILETKLAPEYAYGYGPRIFNFHGKKNQVQEFIIPLLKSNPHSRRATLCLWDPLEDSDPFKRDIPGLVLIDFKQRKSRLNMTVVARSNDLFFGWPANVYQAHVLQKYVAENINCMTGSITTLSISAHIFQDQFPYARKITKMA